MPRPGSRNNPLVLRHQNDLDRATRNAYRPSPEQAQADNYRMAHVVVGGLPITIETPKHYFRYGKDRDGSRWHVRMPADYGYIKGSKPERDDESVDVYLGDDSHKATDLPVWVIDQVHAHNGQFDENKCMIGFPNAMTARKTYDAGFSDGKGPQRTGAVTRMTWDEFRWWVKNGNHKQPVAYHFVAKSALRHNEHSPYGGGTCPCARCRGKSGGIMPDDKTAAPVSDAKALGMLTGIWAKVMHRMTPEERSTMMQDAATVAQSELGKADSLLSGDHGGHPGVVEDQWSGPADASLEVSHAHGPGSSAASGTVPVGPSQEASGDGAAKMEREYSRHSPQSGVQAATERLGREIAGVKGAMKSFFKAFEAQAQSLELIKAQIPAALDETVITAAINTAVNKASESNTNALQELISKAARKAVKKAIAKASPVTDTRPEAEIIAEAVKAFEKEDDKDAHGEKEEREKEHEGKEKDEEEAKSMAAARLRVLARSRIHKAKDCIAKAQGLTDKPDTVKALRKIAKGELKKAQAYLADSQMLRGGRAGPSTLKLHEQVAKAHRARKALGPAQSDNQDHWPNSTEKTVGKAESPPVATSPDLLKAVDQISKAAEGMGLLNASVKDFMSAFAGHSPTDGAGNRLPPVFALAKAGGDKLAGVQMQLTKLHEDNVISFDDVMAARDTLQRIQMELPPDIIGAMVNRLPAPVQDLFNRAAA